MSALTELLGIDLPLLQAPMAGVQGSRLAIALCEAGALGALPCATSSMEKIRQEVQSIRDATRKPFNLNFVCHPTPPPQPERELAWRQRLAADYQSLGIEPPKPSLLSARRAFDHAALQLVLELRPAVVSFHFGLPKEALLAPLRDYGCKILSSATTVEEARWLQTHGVDAVIAQGLEAGGHRGHFLDDDLTRQMSTFALLPQIVAAIDLPVIAAGGITDARGVIAAMALGAAGVQVGTAWLLCDEADTSAVHRVALKSPAAAHTTLTNVFTGRPARGIVNHAIRKHGPLNADAPGFPLATDASAPLRQAAEARGSGDWSPLWCGQNNSGCQPIPAAELLRQLAQGFAQGALPVL